MRKLDKKGVAFDVINKGMISFIAFVFIVMIAIFLVQITKQTDMICPEIYAGDTCYHGCGSGYSYNSTLIGCCNTSTSGSSYDCATGNTTAIVAYSGAAYNATIDLQDAAGLPPQFAQIIVIVIIIVGILAMLTAVGTGIYQKMKK